MLVRHFARPLELKINFHVKIELFLPKGPPPRKGLKQRKLKRTRQDTVTAIGHENDESSEKPTSLSKY